MAAKVAISYFASACPIFKDSSADITITTGASPSKIQN
jgi:hypothetical protein